MGVRDPDDDGLIRQMLSAGTKVASETSNAGSVVNVRGYLPSRVAGAMQATYRERRRISSRAHLTH